MGQADWADVQVGLISIGIFAVAEGFRPCLELHMGLYTNDCLKLGLQARHELVTTSEEVRLPSLLRFCVCAGAACQLARKGPPRLPWWAGLWSRTLALADFWGFSATLAAACVLNCREEVLKSFPRKE